MRFQKVKNIKAISPIVIYFLMSTIVLGQSEAGKTGPPAPNPSNGPLPPPPELELPIDIGLVFLLIAGLGYGIFIATHRIRTKNTSQ